MKNSEIKKLIENHSYKKALIEIEKILKHEDNDSILKEFLYIKRLSGSELTGNQLLLFHKIYNRNDLISCNVDEYCICIDELLKNMKDLNIITPIEYIRKNTPNMDDLLNERSKDFQNSNRLSSA